MKIGILIWFGPEIRSLLLSGLLNGLKNRGHEVVILTRFKLSSKDFPVLNNFKQLVLPTPKYTYIAHLYYHLWRIYLKLGQSRMRVLGFGNFHFSAGVITKRGYFDRFFGNSLFFRFFSKIISFFNLFRYDNNYYEEFLEKLSINKLFFSSFSDVSIHRFLGSCKKSNVELFFITKNWKDVYTDNFYPITLDKITYWNQRLNNDDIKINGRLRSGGHFVTGNLFFYNFKNYKLKNDLEHYENKYKIRDIKNRFKILWPLSQSALLPNEYKIVEEVLKRFEKFDYIKKPLVFLRMNPLGLSKNLKSFYESLPNTILCSNYWSVDIKNDFTFQSEEGEIEWLDLLSFSDLVISSPSTVLFETSLLKKNHINFIFDENDKIDKKLLSFFQNKFFKETLKYENIVVSDNYESLLSLIKNTMKNLILKLRMPIQI